MTCRLKFSFGTLKKAFLLENSSTGLFVAIALHSKSFALKIARSP
ncbi:hypothetical protein [Iningainema tapete]